MPINFLPVSINDGGQPELVDNDRPKNNEILRVVGRLSSARETNILITDGVGHLHLDK